MYHHYYCFLIHVSTFARLVAHRLKKLNKTNDCSSVLSTLAHYSNTQLSLPKMSNNLQLYVNAWYSVKLAFNK